MRTSFAFRAGVILLCFSSIAASGSAEDIPIQSFGFTQFFLGWSHEYSGTGFDGSGLNDVVDVGGFRLPRMPR